MSFKYLRKAPSPSTYMIIENIEKQTNQPEE